MKSIAILVVMFAVGALSAPAVRGFQDTPPEKKESEAPKVDEAKRQAFNEGLEGLQGALKEKVEVDVIHFSRIVAANYAHGEKEAQADAVEALTAALRSKNQDVKNTVIESLGSTGGKASQVLQKEAQGDIAKKNVTYQCLCIRHLGRLKDEKSIDLIVKFFNNKSVEVVGEAVSTLANFAEAKIATKKHIVEETLKIYSPLESAANKSSASTTDKQEYERLRGPIESTLSALTGKRDVNGAFNWSTWWRKEGKKADAW